MNLSEITEKIYAEGVEKGNAQAQEIIAEARRKQRLSLQRRRRKPLRW